ncbi:TetR/AcrR family transcriptional regulator [Vallitalea okinawensis]|uniref:TetR/AcrR family transcriptional regulator n=1 Tax=Vallitalea okinawensis TaxID=2078660 RepID=UPI000CFD3C72|nr:TetR/AcrR family transcriptional regulator [Vallitalea okinawensis]
MLKNQVHPAAIRSRNLITDSLLVLMKNSSYEEITVKEITDQAVLTRRTFYAHFKTKEEVIDYKINGLNGELTSIISNHSNKDHHEIALLYFGFWVDHIDLLMQLYEHNLMQLLFNNFEKNIRDIRSYFGCTLSEQDEQYADYSSAFFTSVLSSILNRWIETGAKESAKELVKLLEQITYKFSSSFRDS